MLEGIVFGDFLVGKGLAHYFGWYFKQQVGYTSENSRQ